MPVNLFLAQIQGESGFNPNVGTSQAGAEGIAQFKPATAAGLGIDPLDPAQALQGAAQYDAQLYQQNGNSWVGTLSSYSGGLTPVNPGNPNYATALADAATADAGGTATANAGDYGLSVSTTDGPATTAAVGATTPAASGTTTTAASTGAGGSPHRSSTTKPSTWPRTARMADRTLFLSNWRISLLGSMIRLATIRQERPSPRTFLTFMTHGAA